MPEPDESKESTNGSSSFVIRRLRSFVGPFQFTATD